MTRAALFALALPLPLLAAGCDRARAPEPTPTPTATVAAPRNLVAADFDASTLGARIGGPDGDSVESTFRDAHGDLATMTSYVACPKAMPDACDPKAAPAGTVFTYVHTVTPQAPKGKPSPAPSATPAADTAAAAQQLETAPAIFRTTERATGFNGSLGYDMDQAQAALGSRGAISVSTDAGRLIWRVTQGSGWKAGMPITFYWQSTVPPKGPQSVFRLDMNDRMDKARGPFPPDDMPSATPSASTTPKG